MAYVDSYVHTTHGTIQPEIWPRAWATFASWKGYLQAFPNFMNMRIGARGLPDGGVRLQIITVWEEPEALEEWAHSKWSAANILRALAIPATDIDEEVWEQLG